MKKIKLILARGLITLITISALSESIVKAELNKNVYETTWESLTQHPIPQWFQDAKFGIYFHWGVYSVPAFSNEWYPRNMYRKEHQVFDYHCKTYGLQDVFGYKDFIPSFRMDIVRKGLVSVNP